MVWQRLFVYRSMINDTVLDAKMYIDKSRDPDPEYWSEELLKIMEKADSDSQLDASEQKDIIDLIEKANEQLNIKLSSTAKFEEVDPNDYTRLDKHLQSEEPTAPPPEVAKAETDLWGRPIQKNLAPPNLAPPPQVPPPQPVQGKILGDLTPGKMMPLGPTVRAIDGIPLEQFLLDKSKSKFKTMRT